MAARVGTAKEL